MVLNDFQRGKLPFYVLPPGCDKDKIQLKENEQFIEKMLAEQNKVARDNPTESVEGSNETEESKDETVLEKTARESKQASKAVQKVADRKNKLKVIEKKKKVELKGLKKKLKNWDKKQ